MPATKPPASPRGKSGLLHRVGVVLWGDLYRKKMSECLGIHDRTVQRMIEEESPISNEVWAKLYEEIVIRTSQLETLTTSLNRYIPVLDDRQ